MMALHVSRFPEAVNIPRKHLGLDLDEKNFAQGREKERVCEGVTKKYKRSFNRLFLRKKSSSNSSLRERDRGNYNPLRVKSFHNDGNASPFSSLRSSNDRMHTNGMSSRSHSRYSSRTSKPKLPKLAIPNMSADTSQVYPNLINPPTPVVNCASMKDTIRILGLSKIAPRRSPLMLNFVSTFSAVSSSMILSPRPRPRSGTTGSSAELESTSTSSHMSDNKPLPPMPASHQGLRSAKSDYKQITQPSLPLRGESLHLAVGGYPTRKPVPGSRTSKTKALAPKPLILARHHHTKSVAVTSPSPLCQHSSHAKNTTQNILAVAAGPQPSRSSPTTLKPQAPSANHLTASTCVSPDSWSALTNPHPLLPHDLEQGERLSLAAYSERKEPDFKKSVSSGGKVVSKAQEDWRQKPLPNPMNAPASSPYTAQAPYLWQDEDNERSAVHSRFVMWGNDEGGKAMSSQLSAAVSIGATNWLASDYNSVEWDTPAALAWSDELIMTKSNQSGVTDIWEELDIHEVISQLRELRTDTFQRQKMAVTSGRQGLQSCLF